MSVLETWPVRNSAASLANHTHFRGFPRTLQANTTMVAQRLIPSKFSPIPHSQMILPLDSTVASHKQINERQCNVMHINMLPLNL